MCDLGEDITERKDFEKYRGSFSVSGKKEWLQRRPWQCRSKVPRHRHWARWDSPALLLPAQVPAAVSAGAGGHTLPYLLTRPHSQILTSYVQSPLRLVLCMCCWSASPQQSELRAAGFKLDCLGRNTDLLFDNFSLYLSALTLFFG